MSGFRIIALSLIFPSPSLQGVFFPEPQATNRGTGAVLTWGQTVNGRLQFGGEIGNNHLDVPTALTQLPISEVTVSQVIITSIAAGGAHTLLSTSEGDVYSAGANLHGQLGVGDLFDRSQLTLVSILRHAPGALYNGTQYVKSMGKQNVIKVAAGPEQSAALTNLGKLFAWGNNVYGQLGLGCGIIPQAGLLNSWDDITNPEVDSSLGANQLPSSNPASNRPVGTQTLINCRPYRRRREPVLVEEMAKTYVDSVVMGRRHTAALTGQCGADKFADGSCRPELVTSVVGGRVSNKLVLGFIRGSPAGAGPEQVLSDAGVDVCTCGQVWMWGNNDYGQLGSGDLLSRYSPSLVTALSDAGIHIVSVSVGELHTVALSIKGNVYTWGYNANGQLGTWDTVHQALPVRVKKPDPGFLFVTSVSAGAYHSIMVTDRGDVMGFGSNREGQLGIGRRDMESHPIPLMAIPPLPPPPSNASKRVYQGIRGLQVSCGAYHCIAVSLGLQVYSWGDNRYGQLGNGFSGEPTADSERVWATAGVVVWGGEIGGHAVGVAAGAYHNLVLLQTGDMSYCGTNRWGNNVCQVEPQIGRAITSEEGGVWWVVTASAGDIVVKGNQAAQFQGDGGSIALYRNETDLGIFRYDYVENQEGDVFHFVSNDLTFPLDPTPDSIASTTLVS